MIRRRKRAAVTSALLAAAAVCVTQTPAAVAASANLANGGDIVVAPGETKVVTTTTRLHSLVIQPGGAITSPAGTSLTLTVNGVETGSRLTATGGTDTTIVPGTYRGNLVLTVAVATPVPWQQLVFPFRQAIYVGPDGLEPAKSVLAAVTGKAPGATSASNILVRSTGEAFNGVYVNNGPYALSNAKIALDGNGRSDFVGYGAAVTATGTNARVVLDHVDIDNQGVVRTGVVADGGSNVIVKDSRIHTEDGVLPAGYQSTVDLSYMEQAPWMLGIVGNARATNLLGNGTKATYLKSDISASGWGVLSTDTGQNVKLSAINSYVHTTADDGYGSYAIGNATEEFLGTVFKVADYATINRGGAVHYGDSTPSAVAALNASLGLGLTATELKSIATQPTVVQSDRFGVMWHGAGSTRIDGGTQFTTQQTTFLDKGQQVGVVVDGTQGARVTSKSGVLMQVMEDDDPGPQMVDGKLLNTGVYHEPTTAPTRVATFDTSVAHDSDAKATFTGISLTGDFYNGTRGGPVTPGGPPGPPAAEGRNLVLAFDGSTITGVLSSSTTKHALSTITAADYQQIGEVSNTTGPSVNNGVVVSLKSSTWMPTGTSYLNHLTLDAASRVRGAHGEQVSMTVDGVPTTIQAGHDYTGSIVVTVG